MGIIIPIESIKIISSSAFSNINNNKATSICVNSMAFLIDIIG